MRDFTVDEKQYSDFEINFMQFSQVLGPALSPGSYSATESEWGKMTEALRELTQQPLFLDVDSNPVEEGKFLGEIFEKSFDEKHPGWRDLLNEIDALDAENLSGGLLQREIATEKNVEFERKSTALKTRIRECKVGSAQTLQKWKKLIQDVKEGPLNIDVWRHNKQRFVNSTKPEDIFSIAVLLRKHIELTAELKSFTYEYYTQPQYRYRSFLTEPNTYDCGVDGPDGPPVYRSLGVETDPCGFQETKVDAADFSLNDAAGFNIDELYEKLKSGQHEKIKSYLDAHKALMQNIITQINEQMKSSAPVSWAVPNPALREHFTDDFVKMLLKIPSRLYSSALDGEADIQGWPIQYRDITWEDIGNNPGQLYGSGGATDLFSKHLGLDGKFLYHPQVHVGNVFDRVDGKVNPICFERKMLLNGYSEGGAGAEEESPLDQLISVKQLLEAPMRHVPPEKIILPEWFNKDELGIDPLWGEYDGDKARLEVKVSICEDGQTTFNERRSYHNSQMLEFVLSPGGEVSVFYHTDNSHVNVGIVDEAGMVRPARIEKQSKEDAESLQYSSAKALARGTEFGAQDYEALKTYPEDIQQLLRDAFLASGSKTKVCRDGGVLQTPHLISIRVPVTCDGSTLRRSDYPIAVSVAAQCVYGLNEGAEQDFKDGAVSILKLEKYKRQLIGCLVSQAEAAQAQAPAQAAAEAAQAQAPALAEAASAASQAEEEAVLGFVKSLEGMQKASTVARKMEKSIKETLPTEVVGIFEAIYGDLGTTTELQSLANPRSKPCIAILKDLLQKMSQLDSGEGTVESVGARTLSLGAAKPDHGDKVLEKSMCEDILKSLILNLIQENTKEGLIAIFTSFKPQEKKVLAREMTTLFASADKEDLDKMLCIYGLKEGTAAAEAGEEHLDEMLCTLDLKKGTAAAATGADEAAASPPAATGAAEAAASPHGAAGVFAAATGGEVEKSCVPTAKKAKTSCT